LLKNTTKTYFPDLLRKLGIPSDQINKYKVDLEKNGRVFIPKIELRIDGENKIFSLLSTKTSNKTFNYLNGVQGQFVDITDQ
jgi:hypothetical protein